MAGIEGRLRDVKIFLKVDFAGCNNISPNFRGCAVTGGAFRKLTGQLSAARPLLENPQVLSQTIKVHRQRKEARDETAPLRALSLIRK